MRLAVNTLGNHGTGNRHFHQITVLSSKRSSKNDRHQCPDDTGSKWSRLGDRHQIVYAML